MPVIDEIDRRILVLLQSDASVPCSKIASEVGLSQPHCWRRIQQFRRDGWISNVVALLDRLERRAAVKTLSELDDRALRDIGIMRSQIKDAVDGSLKNELMRYL